MAVYAAVAAAKLLLQAPYVFANSVSGTIVVLEHYYIGEPTSTLSAWDA